MFWQCNECGGLVDVVPRMSVCPECGTASLDFLPATAPGADLSDLRDHWVQTGMSEDGPFLDFSRA